MFEWTHVVTCKTVGCEAENVSLPQILMPNSFYNLEAEEWVPILDANGNKVYECFCGPCGNKIADIQPYGL